VPHNYKDCVFYDLWCLLLFLGGMQMTITKQNKTNPKSPFQCHLNAFSSIRTLVWKVLITAHFQTYFTSSRNLGFHQKPEKNWQWHKTALLYLFPNFSIGCCHDAPFRSLKVLSNYSSHPFSSQTPRASFRDGFYYSQCILLITMHGSSLRTVQRSKLTLCTT
jgi:hypothetical protein